ncbi:MAG TPA: DUF4019 domain-containing protein [Myxococcales bacterium]|jgi:hypothetical protein
MRKLAIGIVAAFGLVVGMQVALAGEAAKADTKDKEKAAVAAAEAWLKLVDEGKYADSWKQAAEFFKANVKQEQWEQMVPGVRKPLGKLVSRKVKSTTYTKTAPGAPDGEYVIIQFDTSFAEKKAAVETVTPMMDKDGKWHVSGYFIK